MTKETKIGLLVGMGVIILIGILISDHLSTVQNQQPAQLAAGIPEIDQDMVPQPDRAPADAKRRIEPLPLPEELASEPEEPKFEPVVLKQDLPKAMIQTPREPEPVAEPTPQPIVADPQPTESTRTLVPDQQLPEGFMVVDGPGAPARPEPTRIVETTPTRATQLAAPKPAKAPQTVHYVGEKETLSDISRKYYGTTGEWKAIYEANRDKMPNPNVIRPGVRLVIPDKPGMTTATEPERAAGIRVVSETPKKPATMEYTVKSGDTLSGIAAKFYGSAAKWQELQKLNGDRISNPNRLAEGTVLLVPRR